MRNVAFKQTILFDLSFNVGVNHSIKLTYRSGYPYRGRYVLHVIYGVKYKVSKKYVYYDRDTAYKALQELLIRITLKNILDITDLPF